MRKTRASVFAKRTSTNRRRRASGVTLVELLIAIIILMVGMMACLEFLLIALAAAANAQRLVVARTLANDTMEQIFLMRDLNAIGGMPLTTSRDTSTFPNLNNTNQPGGIFPDTFQTVKLNNGADLIRATADDTGALDPRFLTYQIRVLVRSTNSPCTAADPAACPPPAPNDQVKRVIVQVSYPFLRTGKTFTTRLETFMTIPPSQFRVS